MRSVLLYLPSAVLLCWALWWITFGRDVHIDVLWLLLLAVASVLHTREEIRRCNGS